MLTAGSTVDTRPLYDVRAAMRDGVELSADVFLPGNGSGPWPAIVFRTPYDNASTEVVRLGLLFSEHGYAFVAQDVRGRGDSDGLFVPFRREGQDGYDTVEWVAQQAWCDGTVGTAGGSYSAVAQWLAARERPPHLRAIASAASPGRWMEELPYLFGTFSSHWLNFLNVTSGRTMQHPLYAPRAPLPDYPAIRQHRPFRDLPLRLGRRLPVWDEWLAHPSYDDYWQALSLEDDFAALDVPALHITGWFDYNQRGQLFYWAGMGGSPAAAQQWLVVGPWDHAGTRHPQRELCGRDFGRQSLVDLGDLHVRFFDRFLKGDEEAWSAEPRVRAFAMGANDWRSYDAWPPPASRERPFYLRSGGAANTALDDGRLTAEPPGQEPPDRYVYSPDDPTPSYPSLTDQDEKNRPIEIGWRLDRDDTLVYTTDPLEQPLHVAGIPVLVLHAESDCIDTDWHAQLCEVTPGGRCDELATACLRAAYRHGRDAVPTPIVPGEIIEYRLEFTAVETIFLPGTSLRLCIASADYPRRTQNPNTNAPTGDDDACVPAQNAVHHDAAFPSRLLLPLLAPEGR